MAPHQVDMTTWRVYCKAYPDSSLNVSDGKGVNLAPNNRKDERQQWFKRHVIGGIALVNKATNMAMEHVGYGKPVRLSPFNPMRVPDTQKWLMSPVVVDIFYPICAAKDRNLVLDAEDPDSIKTEAWCEDSDKQLWNTEVIDLHVMMGI